MTRLPDRSAFRQASNYWLALASEAGGPLLRAADVLRRRARPTPPSHWRRVLLWGAGHIGDVLYNSGSLSALRAALPQAELWQLAGGAARAVLAGHPALTGLLDPTELAARAGEFDAVICYNSSSGWKEVLAAWRLGIPNRVAYVHKGFSALVTHPLAIRRPQPYPAYFRDLVVQLGGDSAHCRLRPEVHVGPAHAAEAEAFLRELPGPAGGPLLACFVTSRQPSGVWPAERFGAALRLIAERQPLRCVLLGAAEDEPILRPLAEPLGARVAAGRLALPALVAFLRQCAAVLCTDSGPRHLANAAGVPVLFVPNLAVGKIETGRYLETETDLAPDFEAVPPAEQPAVFARIDPAAVAAQVCSVLAPTAGRTQAPASAG
ncbi:MAG: glycosyltransferase family 9 protein [Verrucomicrobia bacterium]|nr:glycosyltransferase family 9 protein [Verrucomicrobiota bacterium]